MVVVLAFPHPIINLSFRGNYKTNFYFNNLNCYLRMTDYKIRFNTSIMKLDTFSKTPILPLGSLVSRSSEICPTDGSTKQLERNTQQSTKFTDRGTEECFEINIILYK